MASLARHQSNVAAVTHPQVHYRSLKMWKPTKYKVIFHKNSKHCIICCTNVSTWEPKPVGYGPTDDKSKGDSLKGTIALSGTLTSDKTAGSQMANSRKVAKLWYLRWPTWLLGLPLLLGPGMVPTLWLPISSIFLGPNMASLLSLTGLDCIFNLGAFLFLLMADACSSPNPPNQEPSRTQAPFGYRFLNMIATLSGFIFPLRMYFGSENGFFQPQLPPISFAILLGPYLLLLAVQMLTEMLIRQWKPPVWLVVPVVYEAYRVDEGVEARG